jgi:hypothetical protein
MRKCRMRKCRIKAQLTPMEGGAYTKFRLSGIMPTSAPQMLSRQLIYGLSFWSASPVSCVLCVDKEETAASWCEWWTELMAGIPGRHLDVRYLIQRTERVWGRR